MPYKTQTGRTLPLDRPFTLGDISYPATWLRLSSPEDRDAIGLTWEQPVEPEIVRAPLESEKTNKVNRAKQTAGRLLAGCDWMVIAKMERDRTVADAWAEYRNAVRVECDRLESQYGTASSYEALDAIVENWPINPDEAAEQAKWESQLAADQAKRDAKLKEQQEEDQAKEGGGE